MIFNVSFQITMSVAPATTVIKMPSVPILTYLSLAHVAKDTLEMDLFVPK